MKKSVTDPKPKTSSHDVQPIRFAKHERALKGKITRDALKNKRSISAQIKLICDLYYQEKEG